MDLQGGPTFEDLSIDDDLSQLERIVRYSSSSIALQRLVHVKMLAETVTSVGFEETVKSIVPLLGPLAEDDELVVRQHLGEQLDDIARFCKSVGKEAGYRFIIEIVLPTLSKLLGDPQAEVRQAAGESLVGVAALMKPLDLGHHVLTIVLQLAHDDDQEELRMTAAALLNDLAESLGNDLCKQFVTPEMESLSEDPVFRVRKATALNLHKICKVVGEAGIQRLLPAYVRLTKDDVYRVRKACTEAIVEMSKAVGAEVSMRELTPVFLDLASDSSKLVRTGALQHLGRLISTLPGESVSQDLVRYFTSTAMESMGDPVADAELRLYCAFSFPAVVLTIGPERWEELREAFLSLLRDPSWSVRKTLSYSLHEMAKVLKPEDVEEDLVPAMEAFLRDMEEVRLGVIRHLGDFFREMSPQGREKHLNVLVEILQTTSPFNWRLRELLAQQLPQLAPLLSLDSVFFAVVPVAFGLLNDPVAVVRENTFGVVAPLLQLAGAHSSARLASMVSRVRELAHAQTYQARQMYVYICHSMACSANAAQDRPLFIQEFVPSLAELSRDAVVNVRVAMSRTLSKCPDWVVELPDIRRAIRQLAQDSNPDVRHFVSFLPPILGTDTSQEEKVAWVDTSSVLSDESVLTQWSVSTQRSVLSVGDFPPVRDVTSPNRSYKINRQRSSSIESAGESGYSTTSSEGEGLKRLSSRRSPLPAAWGTVGTGLSTASSPLYGATAGSGSAAPGVIPEDPAAPVEVPSAIAEGTEWDGGERRTTDEIQAATGMAEGGKDSLGGGEMGEGFPSDEDETPVGNGERGTTPEEALFVREEEVETDSGDTVGLLPASPKRRATSQDAVVIEDDAVDDPIIPPIMVSTPPSEDTLPPSMPSGGGKRLSLTPGEQAEVLAEANQEGMPPSTASLPNPTPLVASGGLSAGPLSPRRRGSGSSRPFEEHSPVWTGDEDDEEEEDRVPEPGSTEAVELGGELNMTPSLPWASPDRDPAAVFPPNASDMGLHTPAHVPPAPPDQAPAPPSKPVQESTGADAIPAGSETGRGEGKSGDESASTLTTVEGKGDLGASVDTEADWLGVESLPVCVAAAGEGGDEGASERAVDLRGSDLGKNATDEVREETGSARDSSSQESGGSINEQNALLSGELRLVVDERGGGNVEADAISVKVPTPDGVGAGGMDPAESKGRATLAEEAGAIDKSRSVLVSVAEDGRKGQAGRE